MNSIKPSILTINQFLRIDQGVSWFHDWQWTLDDGVTPVDLNNWELSARLFYVETDTCRVALSSPQIEITETGTTVGEFHVAISKTHTERIVWAGARSQKLRLEVTAINTAPDLGYVVGQCVSLVKGEVLAFSHCSGV